MLTTPVSLIIVNQTYYANRESLHGILNEPIFEFVSEAISK